MGFGRSGKASVRRGYLIGAGSAAVLAAGLVLAVIVPATARTTSVHSPASAAARAWPHVKLPSHRGRSTRRAAFLSWAKDRTFSNAAIVHTYKVTTTADTTPAACPATASEPCTLRQAVIQANADGTLDKIRVPAATTPYLLETDQLTVTDAAGVVFAGAGQTQSVVQADTTSSNFPFRVLQISNGSAVQISGMTIADGHSTTSAEDGNGGGIEVLDGSLTMGDSTVTGNTADNYGGGIYVAGLNSINGSSGAESQAYLRNVTISNNTAANGGGGLDIEGQALLQGTVTGNTLSGEDSNGGGIRLGNDGAFYPSLSASNFSVTANTATNFGGGLYADGSLELTAGAIGGSSQADGNTAGGLGGGINNQSVATLHAVAIQHNTVNVANGEAGGGIENADRLSMTGGSLSYNSAPNAGGLDNEGAQANLNDVKVSRNRAGLTAGGIGSIEDSSLSVTGGSIVRNVAISGDGGGLYNGATATVSGTAIDHNRALQIGEGDGEGGGIFNAGALNVSGASIADNTAAFDGGGLNSSDPATITGTSIGGNTAHLDGGGIASSGPLALTRVQLGSATSPNGAEQGGGLFTQSFGATIIRSTIAGNEARNAGAGSGGGIFNSDGANTELRQTTLSGNSSDGVGGGITIDGGEMTILTSTISDNAVIAGASQAFGGGISNEPDPANGYDGATLKLVNDTVTGNRAGGGSTAGFGGGLDNQAQAGATITNVTISANKASGSGGTGGGIYNNGLAALRGALLDANTAAGAHDNCGLPVGLTSNGYNLSSDTTCGLNGIGDQTGVNPLLGPLASNGGPTQTQALKAGSPAIDAVKYCPPPKTDQRGVNRQSPCDVGAYERVPDK